MNYQFLPSEGPENANISGPSLLISKDREVSFNVNFKSNNEFVLLYSKELNFEFLATSVCLLDKMNIRHTLLSVVRLSSRFCLCTYTLFQFLVASSYTVFALLKKVWTQKQEKCNKTYIKISIYIGFFFVCPNCKRTYFKPEIHI